MRRRSEMQTLMCSASGGWKPGGVRCADRRTRAGLDGCAFHTFRTEPADPGGLSLQGADRGDQRASRDPSRTAGSTDLGRRATARYDGPRRPPYSRAAWWQPLDLAVAHLKSKLLSFPRAHAGHHFVQATGTSPIFAKKSRTTLLGGVPSMSRSSLARPSPARCRSTPTRWSTAWVRSITARSSWSQMRSATARPTSSQPASRITTSVQCSESTTTPVPVARTS